MLGLSSGLLFLLAALNNVAFPLRGGPHEVALILVGKRPTLLLKYRLLPPEREELTRAFDADHDGQLSIDEREKMARYIAKIAADSFRMTADRKPVTLTPLTPIECAEGCATGADQHDPATVCLRPQFDLGRETTLSFVDDHPRGRVPFMLVADATLIRSSQRPSKTPDDWRSIQEGFKGMASFMEFQLPARRPLTVSLRQHEKRP